MDTSSDLFTVDNDGNYEIKVEMVTSGIYTKVNNLLKQEFSEIFRETLHRIADDYSLDIDELEQKYAFKFETVRRKTLKPDEVCQAATKKGTPCNSAKKQGYNYCGTHLKANQEEEENTYQPRSEAEVKKTLETTTKLKTKPPATEPTKKSEAVKKSPSNEPIKKSTEPTKKPPAEPAKKSAEPAKKSVEPEDDQQDDDQPTDDQPIDDQPTENQQDAQPTQQDEPIEIVIEKIDNKEYIVYGDQIYYYPDDFNVEETNLEDLIIAGKKLKSGKISWIRKQ